MKVKEQRRALELHSIVGDESDFLAELDNSFQVLREHVLIFWCYSQYSYRHGILLNNFLHHFLKFNNKKKIVNQAPICSIW